MAAREETAIVETVGSRDAGARLAHVQQPAPPRGRRWDLARWLPPRRSFPIIGSMRPFVGCKRRQIWRIARWGEVIEARPGDVLVREDHTDYWFFVVLSGAVQTSRAGRVLATLGPGDHFGETAIVGFRPQPATVVAVEPALLFVLGRRHLLTLAASDMSVQRSLFPQTRSIGYATFVRRLQADGRADWERLRPRYRTGRSLGTSRLPGRDLSWGDALEVLSHQSPVATIGGARGAPMPLAKKQILLPVCAAVAAFTVVAALYHPPLAVVTPGRAVDVVGDISISGVRVYKPSGRYLLTPVGVSRPNLAGLFVARLLGRTVVSGTAARSDPAEARRTAHEAFLNSHRQAIAVAEQMLGVRTKGVTIAIRDRGLSGPSAGLVYSLAIADMLGASDLAARRTIAATGSLRADGTVGPVGFVALKTEAARRGRATIFLVPDSQVPSAGATGIAVTGVGTLREAVRLLERAR